MEVSGQLPDPAALPQWKSPRKILYTRRGGPQSRSGRYGEKSLALPGIDPRFLDHPAHSPSLYQPIKLNLFLILDLDESEWLFSCSRRFIPPLSIWWWCPRASILSLFTSVSDAMGNNNNNNNNNNNGNSIHLLEPITGNHRRKIILKQKM
jgi:hypothetical protein